MAKQRCARTARRSTKSVFQFVFTFSPEDDLLQLHGELRPLIAARSVRPSVRKRSQSRPRGVRGVPPAPPSRPENVTVSVPPPLQDWLTVKDCAVLLIGDLEHLDLNKAKARVSRAASCGKFKTNGKTGAERRIDRHSFSTWRLQQRDRALQEAENLFASRSESRSRSTVQYRAIPG